jgi:membrane protein YdbS with pleckstrin-like domain
MESRVFRPDIRLQTKYFLIVVLSFVVFIFPWIFLGFAQGLGWTYVILFLLGNMIWMGIAFALIGPYYRSISYELTDEEIRVRKGIITKTVQTVPYRTITNIEVKRGPLDRLLGIGGIHAQTAGYSQQAVAEAQLGGLVDYEEISQRLYAALRRYRARTGAAIGAEQVPAPEAQAPLAQDTLREILEELRAVKQILAK